MTDPTPLHPEPTDWRDRLARLTLQALNAKPKLPYTEPPWIEAKRRARRRRLQVQLDQAPAEPVQLLQPEPPQPAPRTAPEPDAPMPSFDP